MLVLSLRFEHHNTHHRGRQCSTHGNKGKCGPNMNTCVHDIQYIATLTITLIISFNDTFYKRGFYNH